MSFDDHLNRDLFGNAVSSPLPAPHVYSELPSEDFWADNRKANVPKITPVKEGQEHPVGKHGQYKLFHEHVWPKGYTPERLADVRSNLPNVLNASYSGYTNNEATEMVAKHVARSTIPIEDLNAVSNRNIDFRIGVPMDEGTGGSFGTLPHANRASINLGRKRKLKPDAEKIMPEVHGWIKTNQGHALAHEIGHAVDFVKDPQRFVSEGRTPYGDAELPTKARAEGRAEAYRAYHHRATRAMRRARKKAPIGYTPDKFKNMGSGFMYKAERQVEYDRLQNGEQ